MRYSDYLASAALLVSCISLGLSFWFGYRDKVSLNAKSKFLPAHPEYDRAHLQIKVVNKGRRVAVLTLFGGNLEDGGWQGESLGSEGKGLHLTENQFYERKFYKEDVLAVAPDSESPYVDLWFEDSLGSRHTVKHSKEHIKLLMAQ